MARHIGSLSPLGAIVEPTVESASAVSGTGTTTGVGVAASALEVGTANAAPSSDAAATVVNPRCTSISPPEESRICPTIDPAPPTVTPVAAVFGNSPDADHV